MRQHFVRWLLELLVLLVDVRFVEHFGTFAGVKSGEGILDGLVDHTDRFVAIRHANAVEVIVYESRTGWTESRGHWEIQLVWNAVRGIDDTKDGGIIGVS